MEESPSLRLGALVKILSGRKSVMVKETENAYAYFVSNTGYRFISEVKEGYKVSVPKPEGGYFYATVGSVKLGRKKALRKALKIRNKEGKKLWGKYWDQVRKEFNLLSRLPRTLEPRYVEMVTNGTVKRFYTARHISYPSPTSRERQYRTFKASADKYGKLGAYIKVKSALLEMYQDKLPILQHMGRLKGVQFL